MMLKRPSDLALRGAGDRQRRQMVESKPIDLGSFDARPQSASVEPGVEEEEIGVMQGWRVGMSELVKHRRQLGHLHSIAGFLEHLALGRQGERLSHVDPSAWQGPKAVLSLFDH